MHKLKYSPVRRSPRLLTGASSQHGCTATDVATTSSTVNKLDMKNLTLSTTTHTVSPSAIVTAAIDIMPSNSSQPCTSSTIVSSSAAIATLSPNSSSIAFSPTVNGVSQIVCTRPLGVGTTAAIEIPPSNSSLPCTLSPSVNNYTANAMLSPSSPSMTIVTAVNNILPNVYIPQFSVSTTTVAPNVSFSNTRTTVTHDAPLTSQTVISGMSSHDNVLFETELMPLVSITTATEALTAYTHTYAPFVSNAPYHTLAKMPITSPTLYTPPSYTPYSIYNPISSSALPLHSSTSSVAYGMTPYVHKPDAVVNALLAQQLIATPFPPPNAHTSIVTSQPQLNTRAQSLGPYTSPSNPDNSIVAALQQQINELQKQLSIARDNLPPTSALCQSQVQPPFGQNMMMLTPRQVRDLPEFSGRPEDWPVFYTAYNESTAAYGYSNFENNQRLNKSLKGVAREAVKALLIQPCNVNAVIEHLRFRFGRPEQLIRSQLRQARETPCVPEGAIGKFLQFATFTNNLVVFLQSAGDERHLLNPTLLEELTSKLPLTKRLEWARYSVTVRPYPNIVHFNIWLSDVSNYMQLVTETESQEAKRRPVLHTAANEQGGEQRYRCSLCQDEHHITECQRFKDATISERWNKAKQLRLCFACLSAGHATRECRQRQVCLVDNCRRSHHRLLHSIEPSRRTQDTITRNATEPTSNSSDLKANNSVLNCSSMPNSNILFRILPVTLHGPKKSVDTYALLDEGSSITLMEDSLMRELGMNGQCREVDIQWFGGKASQQMVSVADVEISGRGMGKRHMLRNVHGISNLMLPAQTLRECDIPNAARYQNRLPMKPYENAVPTVLIGLDHSHLGLPTRSMSSSNQGPYAAHTELGWIVFGPVETTGRSQVCLHIRPNTEMQIVRMVEEYFSTESFGVKPLPLVESSEEIRAREMLEQTTTRVGGRFQTGLLWKSDNIKMPESYNMALQRLIGIERKMKKNPEFATAYKNIIQTYVTKNYARKLPTQEALKSSQRTWYLPHFAVYNPRKPGKIRLVFDAAADVNGVSLNSYLLKGPQQCRPLTSVLFNFREGAVGVCADIKEMFHQVVIRPEDRCAQRFLWREGEADRSPDIYEMTVMTFGAACSPSAAHFVKNMNALNHTENDARAIEAITDYHYVDDFVDSFQNSTEAMRVSEQVRDIHKDAGFELHKFVSNSPEVVEYLDGNYHELPIQCKDNLGSEKVLGMTWKPLSDTFMFNLKFYGVDTTVVEGCRPPTKRELLSITMSMFDPLGFLCNFTIMAKLMLRQLWKKKISWDEPIPNEVVTIWNLFRQQLSCVVSCQIPRHYFLGNSIQTLQLHVFVDASEEAFAAVAYWRVQTASNHRIVSLVAAKSRCAPLKQLSIPRLELQAAVLGTRLMSTIIKNHTFQVERCVMWSDSTTVIKWVNSEHRRYKPFVAHRIAEILESTRSTDWKWVPTGENVADEATRLKMEIDFSPSSRWFSGPQFLSEDEQVWPKLPVLNPPEDKEELPPRIMLVNDTLPIIDFSKFSSLGKLKRVIAWVLRFVYRCKHKRVKIMNQQRYGLTAGELNSAETLICRKVQQAAFADEMRVLRQGGTLPRNSELFSLSPYFDDDDILRLRGRLDSGSWIPYETRHPIILPSNHAYTKLIVANEHDNMMHQNNEATICQIRKKFWIPRLRSVLRSVIASCNLCKIKHAKPVQPMMGPLPEDRLTPFIRPFSFTGMDYFGPINVTIGRRIEKRWVALFTCLTVRAIHLEVAYDLSTDACILAMRNFMNRRGVPKRIRSDNGKNFVGVANDIKRFSDVFDCKAIQDELSMKNIEWIFNCPANPSEGGVWERMVQCVKRVLHHTMKEVAPREFTLQSLIIEAENIVNSRPLTHLPLEPDQEEPLTPNHFLLGSANTAQTGRADEPEVKLCAIRKQWRIARELRKRFWKRWVAEYLPTLTRRTKWCYPMRKLQKGDLVFICDSNVPRKDWRRGRVEEVFHGADGEVRRASVRTAAGLAQRPASKLAILDVSSGES